MHLIYEDNPIRRGGSKAFKIEEFDATQAYLKHYGCSLELDFFLQNGDRLEKQRASKELEICNRKMDFWRRAPNFDQARATDGCLALKKRWAR